mgnify:CR=1 FL=1
MTRPVYSFRPNLKNPEHQRAWEKFQSVPEGQKSQYLVQAILEKEDRKWMEEVIQKTIKRKCSGIRNMWHYGTIENETIIGRNTRSDDGFSISNGKFVKGVRPMIARYIHCWIC